jgi:putative transposase
MQYRRLYVPGGSYFFTLVTESRRPILDGDAAIGILREAFRSVMDRYPFALSAAVVLPDHLHCVLSLPEHDQDFSTRLRLIKTWFTKHCDSRLRDDVVDSARRSRGERAIWQHRYWEHLLRDEEDYRRHVEYIHYNPVKHGYANRPVDWPYSSFRHYVAAGIYPESWGESVVDLPEGVGGE